MTMLAIPLICHDDEKSESWLHSEATIAESMIFLHSPKAQCGGGDGGYIDVVVRTAHGYSCAELTVPFRNSLKNMFFNYLK